MSRRPARVPDVLAAVDLGSNSFHMVVARYSNGQLIVIDRLREMVQLASGLDEDGRLDKDVASRALACLKRFGQRLLMHVDGVRGFMRQRARRKQAHRTRAMRWAIPSRSSPAARSVFIYSGSPMPPPEPGTARRASAAAARSHHRSRPEPLELEHEPGCVGISQLLRRCGKRLRARAWRHSRN
jgi:hypothetical protein